MWYWRRSEQRKISTTERGQNTDRNTVPVLDVMRLQKLYS